MDLIAFLDFDIVILALALLVSTVPLLRGLPLLRLRPLTEAVRNHDVARTSIQSQPLQVCASRAEQSAGQALSVVS
jgi:hypothetical protein